jgi:hypothetical protein
MQFVNCVQGLWVVSANSDLFIMIILRNDFEIHDEQVK